MNLLLKKYHNLEHKQRQKINKIIIYFVIGLIIIVTIVTSSNSSLNNSTTASGNHDNPYMEDFNLEKEISLEDKWLTDKDNKIKQLEDQSSMLQQQNQELQGKLEDISQKLEAYIVNNDDDFILNEIKELKSKAESKSANNNLPHTNSRRLTQGNNLNNNYPINNGTNPFSRTKNNYNNSNDNIQNNVITTTPEASQIDIVYLKEHDQIKHYDPKLYLPAGSYASAILISAVDASTSINSQSDPRQVLFRVVTNANSAKQKTKNSKNAKTNVTIGIEGCTITGASYGDLSSERAYVRLLKMTCSRDGKIIETDVEGYASDGSDGKSGLVGKVISREGDLLAKSFIAGIVSGVGSGIAKKFDPTISVADGYTNINSLSNKQIAGQGISEGISKSSQNLSDYLIKRAEQYQPVISVASGKKVELVFISGVYLDGRIIKQKSTNSNGNQQASASNNYLNKQ